MKSQGPWTKRLVTDDVMKVTNFLWRHRVCSCTGSLGLVLIMADLSLRLFQKIFICRLGQKRFSFVFFGKVHFVGLG